MDRALNRTRWCARGLCQLSSCGPLGTLGTRWHNIVVSTEDDSPALDPSVVQPARIAQRLRRLAKAARAGQLPERSEFVAATLDIAADAMLAKRTYETVSGPKTYDAPQRAHAIRAIEVASTIALNPKLKTSEIEDEAPPDAARERLRELGYELVKVTGPTVGSA
jgi:hypothetical protein